MMYLLTENEYKDLIDKVAEEADKETERLEIACIKIACNTPIRFWGRKDYTPWGCPHAWRLLSKKKQQQLAEQDPDWKENVGSYNPYCGECIVRKLCKCTQRLSK